MNINLTRSELGVVERMTGGRITRETKDYLEKARLAYLNAGGEGSMPVAIVICACVSSGAMEDAFNENTWFNEDAAAKKMKPAKEPRFDGDEAEDMSQPIVAEKKEPEPGMPEVGARINYRNKRGAWVPGRYLGPGTQENTFMVESTEQEAPFEIEKKNLDVPDMSIPVQAG